MPTTPCFCGVHLAADDDDGLVVALQGHLGESHGLAISAVMTRNAIERQRMLGPVPERSASLGATTLERLTPAHADDYARFFDDDAFTDNVGWASCYCLYHHVDEAGWGRRTWQQNRTDALERIRRGEASGVVARVDGEVAGWVDAAPLAAYPAHRHGDERDATTGAIVCFVVGPRHRGHGLATLLLAAALDLLADAGMTAVEAYPLPEAGSAAAAYHGTVGMYRAAGFEPTADGAMYRTL